MYLSSDRSANFDSCAASRCAVALVRWSWDIYWIAVIVALGFIGIAIFFLLAVNEPLLHSAMTLIVVGIAPAGLSFSAGLAVHWLLRVASKIVDPLTATAHFLAWKTWLIVKWLYWFLTTLVPRCLFRCWRGIRRGIHIAHRFCKKTARHIRRVASVTLAFFAEMLALANRFASFVARAVTRLIMLTIAFAKDLHRRLVEAVAVGMFAFRAAQLFFSDGYSFIYRAIAGCRSHLRRASATFTTTIRRASRAAWRMFTSPIRLFARTLLWISGTFKAPAPAI
jgi:hypothetical protein